MNPYLKEKLGVRSQNLIIVKFFCCVAVIFSHSYSITLGEEDFLYKYTCNGCSIGSVAVSILFVISGLYIKNSMDKATSLREYIKKRCIRIFPSLWIVVILSIVMGIFISDLPIKIYLTEGQTYLYLLNLFCIPVHDLPGVFLNNPYHTINGPLWTLPIELFMYIVVAIIGIFGRAFSNKSKIYKIIDICSLVFLLAIYVLVLLRFEEHIMISVIRVVVMFFAGMTLYDFREIIKLKPIYGIVGIIIVFLFRSRLIFNILLSLVLPYAVVSITLGSKEITQNQLPDVSYEMYLLGWPVQQLMLFIFMKMNPMQNFFWSLPIVFIVGIATKYISEKICDTFFYRKSQNT